MIDYLMESKATGSGMAPIAYIELIMLPRRGWPKSELDRLSLADRHMLFELMRLEATYANRGNT